MDMPRCSSCEHFTVPFRTSAVSVPQLGKIQRMYEWRCMNALCVPGENVYAQVINIESKLSPSHLLRDYLCCSMKIEESRF